MHLGVADLGAPRPCVGAGGVGRWRTGQRQAVEELAPSGRTGGGLHGADLPRSTCARPARPPGETGAPRAVERTTRRRAFGERRRWKGNVRLLSPEEIRLGVKG